DHEERTRPADNIAVESLLFARKPPRLRQFYEMRPKTDFVSQNGSPNAHSRVADRALRSGLHLPGEFGIAPFLRFFRMRLDQSELIQFITATLEKSRRDVLSVALGQVCAGSVFGEHMLERDDGSVVRPDIDAELLLLERLEESYFPDHWETVLAVDR